MGLKKNTKFFLLFLVILLSNMIFSNRMGYAEEFRICRDPIFNSPTIDEPLYANAREITGQYVAGGLNAQQRLFVFITIFGEHGFRTSADQAINGNFQLRLPRNTLEVGDTVLATIQVEEHLPGGRIGKVDCSPPGPRVTVVKDPFSIKVKPGNVMDDFRQGQRIPGQGGNNPLPIPNPR
ncbi:MAG: hypothetical protein NUV91_04580 [Candidatus Omnitrophica bacterium]|nr:hypothetical protein [Candidatus Omnitrophota bacterium]